MEQKEKSIEGGEKYIDEKKIMLKECMYKSKKKIKKIVNLLKQETGRKLLAKKKKKKLIKQNK